MNAHRPSEAHRPYASSVWTRRWGRARSLTVVLGLVTVVACGVASDDDPPRGDSIELLVVLPDGWPEPIYPGQPVIVVESESGDEFRFDTTGRRNRVSLASPGEYKVGAVIEDGGCYDTAGVADGGNPPIEVTDGAVLNLIDTGELCD